MATEPLYISRDGGENSGGEERRGGEQRGELWKAKGRGKPMRGAEGRVRQQGKGGKKNTGMSSETINTCMLEREGERESAGYFQPVVVMETEASLLMQTFNAHRCSALESD